MRLQISPIIEEKMQHIMTLCKQHNITISCAESCTGGLLSGALTHLAGASSYFDRSFITYSNDAKWQILGVPYAILEEHGAVSTNTVAYMCDGVLNASDCHIALAISGVAGPASSEKKPVGLVYGGLQWRDSKHSTPDAPIIKEFRFVGNRNDIRLESVENMLYLLHDFLVERAKTF